VGRKVVWTVPAADDLVTAVEFIARDFEAFAATLAQRVCEAGDSLVEFSERMTRDRILEALQDLPADATVDDAIERLVFLEKIDTGLAEFDENKGIPHAEVKQRLGM